MTSEGVNSLSIDLTERIISVMNYQIVGKNNTRYIEVFSCETPVSTEQDALDLIALCGENEANLLLLHHEALSEDFFRLKTGVAGAVLQKFINYSVRVAIIIPDQEQLSANFKAWVSEVNKGSQYRVFVNSADAVNWLLHGH
jgi:PadR family transcriptional regulator AphA